MAQDAGSMNFLTMAGWFLLVLFIQAARFNCQSPESYWSIDCGLSKGQSYVDSATRLQYISDDQFVETGEAYDISRSYVNSLLPRRYLSVRSFPNGSRNCYTFEPVVPSNKYLLRVGFLYGNYDALNSATTSRPISFNLYIGVNLWNTVNISDASKQYQYELITVASNDFMYICLVNTGTGTPFISLIEIRQLKSKMYAAANSSQSLNLNDRYYLATNTSPVYRYPDDPYDRIWKPWLGVQWKSLYTGNKINTSSSDMFEVPSEVLQHAASNATTANGSIHFKREYHCIDERYLFLHFAEIGDVPSGSRLFYIHVDNFLLVPTGPYSPPYHMSGAVYNPEPSAVLGIEVLIEATSNSTYEPLLNAMEVHSVVRQTEVTTLHEDFDAIKKIREHYAVKKNWVGDPCSPKNYSWDGVGCNYTAGPGTPPTIISLNLSSSELSGPIEDYFSDFESIQILDLSNNQLSGDVPSFLATMSSLTSLNLTGNCLGTTIPDELLQRSAAGTLTLRYDNTTKGCGSNNPKKKSSVVVIVAAVALVIIAATLVWFIIRKRKQTQTVTITRPTEGVSEYVVELGETSQTIRFTKSELEKIIKTSNKCVGGGGFGEVFYGKLENHTEIAIKVLSRTSSQGYKEFKKEVQALSSVYHRNIVTFIGYCEEGEYLALVYEYMPNRSLADQLHEECRLSSALSWDRKLKIAHGAAQGLEYLHTGHRIVHRDVKSANILLDQNFEAKVSDFGMSRIFDESTVAMTQSTIGGTFGYLDPEVLTGLTKKLGFSSDVYSFGVVLLEMLTGQPPYSPERGRVHIVEYVLQNTNAIDPKMGEFIDPKMGEYDTDSVMMVINLAMKCTQRPSKDRPTMPYVVLELQQCIDVVTSSQWSTSNTQMSSHIDDSSLLLRTFEF